MPHTIDYTDGTQFRREAPDEPGFPGGRMLATGSASLLRLHEGLRDRMANLHLWETPLREVAPKDNVYSYFMFIAPTESVKHKKKFTMDMAMAYVLVFLTLLMQGVLLYTIFSNVVETNEQWQDGILHDNDDRAWNILAHHDPSQCVDPSSSLCFYADGQHDVNRGNHKNGQITCAPPSIQLTGRWDELDLDGDGIWSFKEAEATRESLQCKYGVDPTEFFDVIVNFVLEQQGHGNIWVHPDLAASKAIHKVYFTYAIGDIIMCGYRDDRMCANLLERDFFQAPLKMEWPAIVPRVGNRTESALNYCYDLLRPGGTCEKILPSTYAVWKIQSIEECHDPSYHSLTYEHPVSGHRKSLLTVDWGARMEYQRAQMPMFMVYKLIILSLWFLAMVHEGKDISCVFTWLVRFPSDRTCEGDAVTEDLDEDQRKTYTIWGISHTHRFLVGAITCARCVMLICLTLVGKSLLERCTDYLSLIFDALSLVFVLEISNILYAQVLRPEVREEIECVTPMQVKTIGFSCLINHPGFVDAILLFGVLAVALIGLLRYNMLTVKPLERALECACLSEGTHCREAQLFSYDFWYNYYTHLGTLWDQVDLLKNPPPPTAEPAAANATAAVAMSGLRRAMNAHQLHLKL